MLETKDYYFMNQALIQAQKAFKEDEVPVGAIVVDIEGKIIGRGYNQVEKKHQQLAHAEVNAIAQACKKRGDWRLDGCWLYVTLEPCMMCMGLIRLSRLQGVVFGTKSKLFGYQLDKEGQISLYNKDIEIKEGILAQEAADILKQFFKQKRKIE
ncbi:MAG: nucleoside deaminase [Candidatus Babeliales bacterium]